jgi:hypothetical protein
MFRDKIIIGGKRFDCKIVRVKEELERELLLRFSYTPAF